jgi:hypothetical protein
MNNRGKITLPQGVSYSVRQESISGRWAGSNTSDSGPEDPCGGGVEYLHRDPASRRKRQKGKSQN